MARIALRFSSASSSERRSRSLTGSPTMISPQAEQRYSASSNVTAARIGGKVLACSIQACSYTFLSHGGLYALAGDACLGDFLTHRTRPRQNAAFTQASGAGSRHRAGCEDAWADGRQDPLLLPKHSHRYLPSFNSCTTEDFQDTPRELLRHVHKREPLVDVNGTDQI